MSHKLWLVNNDSLIWSIKHQMHGEFWKRTGEHSKIYLTLTLFQVGLSKMNFENFCLDDSIFIFKPVQNFPRLDSLQVFQTEHFWRPKLDGPKDWTALKILHGPMDLVWKIFRIFERNSRKDRPLWCNWPEVFLIY